MSIFNQPLHPKVESTLTRRQDIISKEIRSTQDLAFLNSKTSWVKLSSSVNINNSSNLAQANILQGGTLTLNKQRAGIGEGITNAYSLKNSDGSTNLLGVKPMPGITSISIDNIGAYGSLRKATINFQCWDIKQLEILEKLYMRPGYTLLLEFGRTTYINDKNKLVIVDDDKDFFSQSGISNLQDYLNSLYTKSVNQEGNYDAFFGYITNYAWSARSDGGYDCKTELISTGELLESLKVNYSFAGAINYQSLSANPLNPKFKGLLLPSLNFPKDSGPTAKDITRLNNEYAENIISGLMYEVYLACFYNEQLSYYRVTPFTGTNQQTKNINIIINGVNITINYGINNYKSTADPADPKKQFLIGDTNIYITLESFCQLFTNFILPKAFDDKGKSKGNLIALSTTDRTYPKFSLVGSPLLCLYNPLTLSTNPDVCWIKSDEWINIIKGTIIESKVGTIKTSLAPDPDINGNNPLKTQIVEWIHQLINKTNSLEVLSSIERYVKDKSKKLNKSENEIIQIINKNYTYLRGGKGFIQPNSKEVVNVDQYTWEVFIAFGGTKDDRLKLQSKYIKKSNTFGDLIQATEGGRPTNKQFDLLNKLKIESPETEQYVAELQQNINEAAQIEKQNQANKTELSNLSEGYRTINNYFSQNFVVPSSTSSFGQIGNIYVNLKNIYNTAKDPGLLAQDQSSTGKLSASSFLKKLLQDIQTSLCNVNQFELHIDPIDGIGRIIDLNYVNKDASPNLFKFEIGSNKSIVRELKLESQIFSDQSSIVAISAQNDAGKLGLNNSTLVGFNEGITDRNILKKDSYLNDYLNNVEKKEQTIVANYVSSLSFIVNEYLKNFLGKGTRTASGVTPEQIAAAELRKKSGLPGVITSGPDTSVPLFTTIPVDNNFDYNNALSYSNSLRDIIYFFTSLSSFNTDNKGKSFIPTLLSMTIDGLAGFIIGNLFKVDSQFVPNFYKKGKNASYIVTKVNHEITNNDWTTTISGYPFNLDSNASGSVNVDNFKVVVNVDPNPIGTVNGNPTQSGTLVSLQRKSFIDSLANVRAMNPGVTYKVLSPNVNDYIFDPVFNSAMETLFDELAKSNIKNENLVVISGIRNREKATVGDKSSKHPYGRALDFQILGKGTQKSLVSANYPNWRSGVFPAEDQQRINNVVNTIITKFNGKPLATKNYYQITVGSVNIKFLNEYNTPSDHATGPHFHFELL